MGAIRIKYKKQAEVLVEVAYALPSEQLILQVKVSAQITAEQAIKASTILDRYPEINLNINKIGLFGKLIKLDRPLRHLDRVEIYRALIADPKEVRKQRAAEGKAVKTVN
ncbi:MAG: RnfH family protein [Bacteroidia bacterium]|nr:RnfH family protein [Methylotenera sp.]